MSKTEDNRWRYRLELESRKNIRWIIIMGGIVISISLFVIFWRG